MDIIKKIIEEIKNRYYNFKIFIKYPIFWPKNVWTGKKIIRFFDYTLLDCIPKGWKKAFGLQMAKEIQECLNKLPKKERKKFIITQIKEKYGSLRIYMNYYTKELDKIISKYEKLSKVTCITCGQKATYMSVGYISPYCNNCKNKNKFRKYKKINNR